jgi:hypothetical protein
MAWFINAWDLQPPQTEGIQVSFMPLLELFFFSPTCRTYSVMQLQAVSCRSQ